MDNQVSKPDFLILKQLGLRENAIACYEVLYMEGSQSARDLARAANKPRTSVYHALSQLEQRGFVRRDKIEIFHEATRFTAIRLDKALENLAIYQRRAVQRACRLPD